MKLCILGNGLTSLSLAKCLVNLGMSIIIFPTKKNLDQDKSRTIGISKKNLDFFNKKILNINKFLWKIYKIEIYSENLKNEKVLNFENKNEELFSVIKNFDLYKTLFVSLKKSNLVKFKKKISYDILKKKNYKLIFNCDFNNLISKKFFNKRIKKDYNSFAYISILKHEKLSNNQTASQIFTKKGPLAFLPISPTETSIVYSIKNEKSLNLENLIKKYNTKYKIIKIQNFVTFKLESLNLRSYYHENIIAFGDLLHKIHPLAGQGFNMTIRDIKEINELIQFKINHGLDLDTSICLDFEKNTKNRNYLFSNGINFIYEFFNFENKINNNSLSKTVKFLGNNYSINSFFKKFANKGLEI